VRETVVPDEALTLVEIGVFMLLGLAADFLGRRTPLPRVTLLLLLGVLLGPAVLDLLPARSREWLPLVANMALVMVGFLLGGSLTGATMRRHGRAVVTLSVTVVLVTGLVMAAGLLALGVPVVVALVLASVATATDPAATIDVIHEERARGPFSTTLRGIVAADDAWGLILFCVFVTVADAWNGAAGWDAVRTGAWELGGALGLGAVLGAPMAYLTGRLRPGEPTLVEALGLVMLCGGLALWLDVSFLLAAMTMGAFVASLARHHKRPFAAIQEVEWPFLVLFFLLSGAALRVESLVAAGVAGGGYVVLRLVGRMLGSHLGSVLCSADPPTRAWLGIALLPQAGVAVGMALVAAERYPQHADTILPIAIGATVFFELIGPVGTRMALRRVGEVAHRAVPSRPATHA
jgi:Kef-type K+ transport system membrane component KefB